MDEEFDLSPDQDKEFSLLIDLAKSLTNNIPLMDLILEKIDERDKQFKEKLENALNKAFAKIQNNKDGIKVTQDETSDLYQLYKQLFMQGMFASEKRREWLTNALSNMVKSDNDYYFYEQCLYYVKTLSDPEIELIIYIENNNQALPKVNAGLPYSRQAFLANKLTALNMLRSNDAALFVKFISS